MPFFRFVPATHERDPRWLGRRPYEDVVVRAPTSGAARHLAATLEAPGAAADMAGAVGNGCEPRPAALDDEKLYRMEMLSGTEAVLRDGPDGAAWTEGPPAIVAARRRSGPPAA
jgi:hypothetical protein